MEVLDNLYLAFLISVVLFLWNETDFFIEYCILFGLWDFFKVGEYMTYKDVAEEGDMGFGSSSVPVDIKYLDYLLIKHNCFFVRLIACPICLGVWMNLGALLVC